MARRFAAEVWNNAGNKILDISPFLKDRSFAMELNGYETLDGIVDMEALTRFTDRKGEHPMTVLEELQNNIRFKLDREYLFGTQITLATPDVNSSDSTIALESTGYLGLFNERTFTATFDGVESTSIFTGIADATQGVPGGDMGVTIGAQQYVTGVSRDRTEYIGVNSKDKMLGLTRLRDGQFDFKFSADKVLTTHKALGRIRSDVKFILGKNIERAGWRTVLPYNFIHGRGYGFGEDQLKSDLPDDDSISRYYMRERTALFNSVVEQSTLDRNTQAVLDYRKNIRRIPTVTITGSDLPSLRYEDWLMPGDRLFLDFTAKKYLDSVYGWYRLERLECDLDDNDWPKAIRLYFDSPEYLEEDYPDA